MSAQFHIDVIYELEQILPSCKLLVPTAVLKELKHIKNKQLIDYIQKPDTVSIHYQTRSALEEEEEIEIEKERGIEKEMKNENLIYDIETYIKDHPLDFEAICRSTTLGNGQVREVVKKYHLWSLEKNKYPKSPLQLIAGIKRWLINETGNSKTNTNPKSDAPPLTKLK